MTRNASCKFVERVLFALVFGLGAATSELGNLGLAHPREPPQQYPQDPNRYSVSDDRGDSQGPQKYILQVGDHPDDLNVKYGLNVKIGMVGKPTYNAWRCQIVPPENEKIKMIITSLTLKSNNSMCGLLKIEFPESKRQSAEFGCHDHTDKQSGTIIHGRPIFLTMILYEGVIAMNLISEKPGFNLICKTFPGETPAQIIFSTSRPTTTDDPDDDNEKDGADNDDDDDDNEDAGLNPALLGIVIALAVLLVIVSATLVIIFLRIREKLCFNGASSRQGQNSASGGADKADNEYASIDMNSSSSVQFVRGNSLNESLVHAGLKAPGDDIVPLASSPHPNEYFAPEPSDYNHLGEQATSQTGVGASGAFYHSIGTMEGHYSHFTRPGDGPGVANDKLYDG